MLSAHVFFVLQYGCLNMHLMGQDGSFREFNAIASIVISIWLLLTIRPRWVNILWHNKNNIFLTVQKNPLYHIKQTERESKCERGVHITRTIVFPPLLLVMSCLNQHSPYDLSSIIGLFVIILFIIFFAVYLQQIALEI